MTSLHLAVYICVFMWKLLRRVWLFAISWTIQSVEFSRPEYWSGQPFPSPGNLPDTGIWTWHSTLTVDSLLPEPSGKPVCLVSTERPLERGASTKYKVKLPSCVWLFVTPRTSAYQAPLSRKFSRQEYWSRFPFPFPGNFLNPGIGPKSPALWADNLPSELPGKPGTSVKKREGNKCEEKHPPVYRSIRMA